MKTVKIIYAALIAMFIFSTSATGQKARKDRSFRHEVRKELRANHLNLSDEQKAKVAELRNSRFEANKELRENLSSLGKQLHQLLREENNDLIQVNQIVDEMASARAEIQKENIKFRREFRAMLTDGQRETLNKVKMCEGEREFKRPSRRRER